VLFDIDGGANQQYIQIHCYTGGDACPNLQLVAELGGNTTDWLASMFGAYNLSLTTNYKVLQMSDDPAKLDSLGGLLFPTSQEYYNRIRHFQWPNKAFREFPTQLQLSQGGFSTTVPKVAEFTLENIAHQFQDPLLKKRICIFSCGNVGNNATDAKIRDLWKQRINHTYKISMVDYGKRINRLGEVIYDIYNVDIGAYGLSPASKFQAPVSPFALLDMPAALPSPRASKRPSKASWGSRRGSRRASKASKASKGSRRGSRQSLVSQLPVQTPNPKPQTLASLQ
jgi:hypothetical protein